MRCRASGDASGAMPCVWKCFRKLSVMLPHRFRKASELVPHCFDETPTPSAPTLDPSAAFSHLLCRGFPKTFYFALFNFALYVFSARLRGRASPMCRLGQNCSSSWPHSWLLLSAARAHAIHSCSCKLTARGGRRQVINAGTVAPL